jgi:hypothetical protein
MRVLLRVTSTATRDLLFQGISERPMILTYECRALGEVAITTYFKRFRFNAAGKSGAQIHNPPNAKR